MCDVHTPEPSNWLRSDAIRVTEAKRIDVRVQVTMMRCANISGTKPNCRHDLDLYVHQTTMNMSSDKWPLPPTGYRKIGNVTATDLWDGRSANEPRNTVILSVAIKERESYVFLALHDRAACAFVWSFLVSCTVCPSVELSAFLIKLPRTFAPDFVSDVIKVKGSCVENSVVSGSHALCQSNGEWNTSNLTKCLCKRGFMATGRTKCKGEIVVCMQISCYASLSIFFLMGYTFIHLVLML